MTMVDFIVSMLIWEISC